jgi:predicted amidohydrolase
MNKLKILMITALIFLISCNKDWVDYSPMDMYSANIEYDDSQATKFLNVAAVSMEISKDDKNANIQNIKLMTEKIKSEHSDIQVIVFPELALEWYWDETQKADYQKTMAETIPGAATDSLTKFAFDNNVTIVCGLTEIEGDKLYNTQVLIRPNGELIKYRKRNLNVTDLDNEMQAGEDKLVTTEIDGIKVCLFICSDMQSNKITKEIAESDIDVILHSLTSSTDMNPNVSYLGLQMNKWVVFANRFGTEGVFNYTGFVQIINPVGTVSLRQEGSNVYAFRKLGIY